MYVGNGISMNIKLRLGVMGTDENGHYAMILLMNYTQFQFQETFQHYHNTKDTIKEL